MACRIKHCTLISGDNGNPYDWNDGRLTSYLHIGSTTFSWSNIKKMALNLATFVFPLVVQVVCDSFPGSWPLYQNHTCPSASSELVIEFLGHDVYQDLDCSLVLLLISRTQPRNIPHTIQNSSLWNCSFWSWTYRKKLSGTTGGQDIHVLSAREFQRQNLRARPKILVR